MINNIISMINKFFKEVWSDLKKLPFKKVFSDTRLLVKTLLGVIAIGIIFYNLNIFAILKGLACAIVFYFVFLWRK